MPGSKQITHIPRVLTSLIISYQSCKCQMSCAFDLQWSRRDQTVLKKTLSVFVAPEGQNNWHICSSKIFGGLATLIISYQSCKCQMSCAQAQDFCFCSYTFKSKLLALRCKNKNASLKAGTFGIYP